MRTFTPVNLSPAWLSLQSLALANLPSLRELLTDASRSSSMQLQACGIHMDFTHQRVNETVLQALQALAKDRHVDDQLRAMFEAEAINTTENRSVLHIALRGSHLSKPPWGQAVSSQVENAVRQDLCFRRKNAFRGLCRPQQLGHHRCGEPRYRWLRPWAAYGDYGFANCC